MICEFDLIYFLSEFSRHCQTAVVPHGWWNWLNGIWMSRVARVRF